MAPLAYLACFSQTNPGGPGGVDFDASSDAADFDSSLPEAATPEAAVEAAPVVDAAHDAPVEAGPQPVVIVVGGAAGFEAGVPVVWGDASGAVVAQTTTDATGKAATLLPNVASVTVVMGTALATAPYTVLGVTPGQTILVVDRTSVTGLAPLMANVPAVPTTPAFDAGTPAFRAQAGGCGLTGALPIAFSLLGPNLAYGNGALPCVGLGPAGPSFGAVFPMVVDAFDGTTGSPLGFAYARSNGITSPDDAGLLDVTLPSTWSTASADQTLYATNLPDGGLPPTFAFSEVVDGILSPLSLQAALPGDGGTPLGMVHTHPGFADRVQAEAFFSRIAAVSLVGTALVSSGPPPTTAGSMTFDAAPVASEPAFTGGTTDQTNPAQPVISWTLARGDLGQMTGVVVVTSWNARLDGGATQTGNWTIVSPGTSASSVQIPALPASLVGFTPAAGAVLTETIYAVDGQTALPSYASMLPMGSLFGPAANPCYAQGPMVPPLPLTGTATGTAAIVVFVTNAGC